MALQYLTESFTVDCSKDLTRRQDIFESLQNGKIMVERTVEKDGKTFNESVEMDVLGVYKCPLSKPGEKNKNNRTYTLETWKPVINARQGEGSLGLLNHPKVGDAPDIEKVCCVWRNHRIEEGANGKPLLVADMYVLNDKKGNGDLIESIIKAGGVVDLSTRGFGDLDENNVVRNYQYNSTDVVYQGSYGVQFGKDARHSSPSAAVVGVRENVNENVSKNESNSTNNKVTTSDLKKGDFNMSVQKVLIKESVKKAFENENKFAAFTELSEMYNDIKGEETLVEVASDISEKIKTLKGFLQEAHQMALQEEDTFDGDSDDDGSAGDYEYPDENGDIQDTDEDLPDDIDEIDVEDTDDTDDSEQGPLTNPGTVGRRNARSYEVQSGEQMERYYAEGSDEELPDDIDEVEVEEIEDTEDDEQGPLTNPGTVSESVNLYKLSKAELIDAVVGLSEALEAINEEHEGLAHYTTCLENYTLMAESRLSEDLDIKQEAQYNFTESVEYVKQLQAVIQEQDERESEILEYVETLEEQVMLNESVSEKKENVLPYVADLIRSNRKLESFQEELLNSGSVAEVQKKASKYIQLGEKVRLDMVPNKKELTESVKTSDRSILSSKGWL